MPGNLRGHVESTVGRKPTQDRTAERCERGLPRCAPVSQCIALIARFPSCRESSSRTQGRPTLLRATPHLAECNARALRNSAAGRQSVLDNIAPLYRVVFLPPLAETHLATTPALDRSNIFRSAVAAPPWKPRDARSSFGAASASADCCRCR